MVRPKPDQPDRDSYMPACVIVFFVIPIFSFVIIKPLAPKFVCVSRGHVVEVH